LEIAVPDSSKTRYFAFILEKVLGMSKKGIVIIFLITLIALPPCLSQGEYLYEFNNDDEVSELDSSWTYLTSDGIQHRIDVYRYCKDSECILVIFDISNKIILNRSQTISFFDNYKLKGMMREEGISTALYDISFERSITCDFIAPKFKEEVKNVAVKVTAEEILPHLLPKNATELVSTIYKAGKDIGIVKSPNVGILVLGASCYGGDFLENIAYSTLTSCKYYVENLENNKAYEGQIEDLIGCHQEAISKLDLAKKSPDVLMQHIETGAGNIIKKIEYDVGSTACNVLGIFGKKCNVNDQKFDESSYTRIVSRIQKMEEKRIDSTEINSWSCSVTDISMERLEQKRKDSMIHLSMLSNRIETIENELKEYNKFDGVYLMILNLLKKPAYNFTEVEINLDEANGKYYDARNFYDQHKYNSAIKKTEEGMNLLNSSSLDIMHS